jgi:hypothetical protein
VSAQDKETGAPSGARNAVYAFAAWLSAQPGAFSVGASEHPSPLVDAAEKFLAQHVEQTASLTLKIDTSDVQAALDKFRVEFDEYQAQHKRLVRELDVALNGEAGAAKQASLCDLVAQVKRQQSVQIMNLADGMRINFRAPSGRRGTLHLSRIMRDIELGAMIEFETGIGDMLRAAIAAYPLAGEPLPEIHSDDHDAAQVQALGASQVHPESALPSTRPDK